MDIAISMAKFLSKYHHETLYVTESVYGPCRRKEYHIKRITDFVGCNPDNCPCIVFTAVYKSLVKQPAE